MDDINSQIKSKYSQFLEEFWISESVDGMFLSKIIIKDKYQNLGYGSLIMNEVVEYADSHKKVMYLSPSNAFGGDEGRLFSFYRQFGFKVNHSEDTFETMVRHPKKISN